jgi:hypothetical protein
MTSEPIVTEAETVNGNAIRLMLERHGWTYTAVKMDGVHDAVYKAWLNGPNEVGVSIAFHRFIHEINGRRAAAETALVDVDGLIYREELGYSDVCRWETVDELEIHLVELAAKLINKSEVTDR